MHPFNLFSDILKQYNFNEEDVKPKATELLTYGEKVQLVGYLELYKPFAKYINEEYLALIIMEKRHDKSINIRNKLDTYIAKQVLKEVNE